jgi:formylglycine-generating enzyme required for sulfatase activity
MGGNVSEWTATELSESGFNSHRYVVKGASWIVPRREDALFACGTDRAYAPHYRDPLVGMRCARSDERSLAGELVSEL